MTFSDIFKSSFLENISAVSVLDMVLALLLSFGIGYRDALRNPLAVSALTRHECPFVRNRSIRFRVR